MEINFDSVSVPALILAVGTVAKWFLPLLSERVNQRAVRLAKAKRK